MTRFIFLLCQAIGISVVLVFGQVHSTSQEHARKWQEKANDFFQAGNYDSAAFFYSKAGIIFRERKQWRPFIRCLLRSGDSYRLGGKYQAAEKALEQAEQSAKNRFGLADTTIAEIYNSQGLLSIATGEYEEAVKELHKALRLKSQIFGDKHLEVGEIYNNLGNAYFYQADYDRAERYYRKDLQISLTELGEENLEVAKSYYNIGIIYDIKGHYDRALKFYQKSLDRRLKLLGNNHPKVADCYNGLAIIHHFTGDHYRALDLFNKSLAIRKSIHGKLHPLVAQSYNNIGLIYGRIDKFDRALDFLQTGLEIRKELFKADHPVITQSLNNIGLIYLERKDYPQALSSFNQALQSRIRHFGEIHPLVASCRHHIAMTYYEQGRYQVALDEFRKTIDIRRQVFGKHHPDIADAYRRIGDIYAEQNELEAALDAYQQSLMVLNPGFQERRVYANPRPDKTLSEQGLFMTLLAKATTLSKRARVYHQTRDLRAAHAIYSKLYQLSRDMRRDFRAEKSKLFLAEEAAKLYPAALATAMQLYRQTEEQAYLQSAFQFSEAAKANILLDAITESQARHFANLPDSLLERERTLRVELAYLDTRIKKERDTKNSRNERRVALQNRFFALKQQYDKLIDTLERRFPEYYEMKHRARCPSLKQVQEALSDSSSAILEYLVGEEELYIFLITKNRVAVQSVKTTRLRTLVTQFRQALINLNFDLYLDSAHQLYSILIASMREELTHVRNITVIADGILHYLPFEALLTEAVAEETVDFSTFPYLIREFKIDYSFSVGLLMQSKEDSPESTRRTFIGFAPVFAGTTREIGNSRTLAAIADTNDSDLFRAATRSVIAEGRRFSALPETRREVEEILRIFEQNRGTGRVLLHNDAREALMKSETVSPYGFVHLATHSFVNDQQPELSGVILAQRDLQSEEDGILYAGEVYNLQLNARLVVLSACESGLGAVVKGEGILGLTRGFIYAGAQNVVVSLWQVADASTSELMIAFYGYIHKGMRFSRALRKAKLDMIDSGTFSYPLEWSAFVLTRSRF